MSLIVTKKEVVLNPSNNCWVLDITVTSPDEDDTAVFVYQRTPEGNVTPTDSFSNVASVQDMDSIPIGEAGLTYDNLQIPYYRISSLVLNVYFPEEVDRIWNTILFDIKSLKNNQKLLLKVTPTEVITIS